MSKTPPEPTVDDELTAEGTGWCRHEERTGVQFEVPTLSIRDHTVVYEDDGLRRRVRAATGLDRTWRFFFATALSFTPPLPPITGPASVFGTVRSEACSSFVADLESRDVRDVRRTGRERVRSASGDRISLTRYRGRLRPTRDSPFEEELPVGALLGVWTNRGAFRLAGGGYPEVSLATVLDGAPETDPSAMRDELLELVRGTR